MTGLVTILSAHTLMLLAALATSGCASKGETLDLRPACGPYGRFPQR